MRLPNSAHTAHQSWRIHALTRDFRLEDVWALPTPGGPADFPALVALMGAFDPARSRSLAARSLFAIRWKIGELLGWDQADGTAGGQSLRDRLPPDLRDTRRGQAEPAPFAFLYQTGDEWAAEIANRTVHGILHLGWVPQAAGGYRGQLAIYVKRNGALGAAYMAAIKPFRYLIVYPAMIRQMEQDWRERLCHPAHPLPR